MIPQLRNNPEPTSAEERQKIDEHLAATPRFLVQQEIHKLQKNLNEFNERIAELEKAGHPDRAMEELKANAIDFARQIDELRYLLVQVRCEETPIK